ncbi:MAG: Brp/Blh family beta-carotene 15,15'-dioxygenase [Sphingobacteriales bacterium]|nr:Brp/Blh family beta-carotene 15,15'-dioxygenase [Sphingobacteriales bacterium]
MLYINSRLFKIQLIAQVALILLIFLISFSVSIQAVFAGILLCVVGIPHGANDHLYRKDQSSKGMLKFLGVYLGIIAAYAILWYLLPLVALILFFGISFHHFGQSNFENEEVAYLPSILWGLLLLAFPVIIHFQEAINIFKSMLDFGNFTQTATEFNLFDLRNWQIVSLLILVLVYNLSLYIYQRKYFLKYFLQLLMVSLWYFFTPLLFGFVIVFCLWHAMQSTQYQLNFYTQSLKKSKFNFFVAMLPFSLIALLGFGIFVYFFTFNVSQAFILLSLITLPHVLVMHKLYQT